MDKKNILALVLVVGAAAFALFGPDPSAERAGELLTLLASWPVVVAAIALYAMSRVDLQSLLATLAEKRDVAAKWPGGEFYVRGGQSGPAQLPPDETAEQPGVDDDDDDANPEPAPLSADERDRIAAIVAEQALQGVMLEQRLAAESQQRVGWIYEYANLALAVPTRLALQWIAQEGDELDFAQVDDRLRMAGWPFQVATILTVLQRLEFITAEGGKYRITPLGKGFIDYKPAWGDIRPVPV